MSDHIEYIYDLLSPVADEHNKKVEGVPKISILENSLEYIGRNSESLVTALKAMLERVNEEEFISKASLIKSLQEHIEDYQEVADLVNDARAYSQEGNTAEALHRAVAAGMVYQRVISKGLTAGLSLGRALGPAKRAKKSKEQHQLIKNTVDDLYRQNQGWKMSYPQIVRYLVDRGISTLAESTTLRLVKKYAPEIKAKYSQE